MQIVQNLQSHPLQVLFLASASNNLQDSSFLLIGSQLDELSLLLYPVLLSSDDPHRHSGSFKSSGVGGALSLQADEVFDPLEHFGFGDKFADEEKQAR